MKEHGKRIGILLFMLCVMFVFQQPALSVSTNDTRSPELIVLLDISTSMDWNDPETLAPDALKQLVGSLPSHWNIGLVTFHADVVDAIAPGSNTRSTIYAVLDEIEYSDWTSSGTGLLRAIELFSPNATSRTIVFVTDGEKAHMPTSEFTEEAALLADTAIAQLIASDIQVHTIVVGEDFDIRHESIMGLAHATGGYLFEGIASEELSGIASTLVFDVFGTSRNQVGTAQITDAAGSFTVRLPAADMARVLITAESPVDNIAVSGGGSVEIRTGERFAIVEFARPTEQEVTIAFTASGMSTAELILEWDLQLMSEVCAEEKQARLWLSDSAGTNVLRAPFFSNRSLSLSVDGIQKQAQAQDGYILLDIEPADEQTHTLRLYLAPHGINISPEFTAIVIDAPPLPEEPEEESNMLVLTITIVGLVFLIMLLIFFYFRPKRTKPTAVTPRFESNFEFTGKLNLYVTRTPEDIDIPPQTFDLFRLDSKREISLRDILDKCHIPNPFTGVEKIYFVAGKQGSIQVVNDSDCTVLIGSDILVKKRSHVLEYGEKIHITCEDEISELELHYKSVKPNEQKVLVNPLIQYAE